MPNEDKLLRQQLVDSLLKANAHVDTLSALKDFPEELFGKKPKGAPHSAWQLLEHIRFTLNDLLVFSTNPDYVAPKWPEAYWPKEAAPPNTAAWKSSVKALKADMDAFAKLLQNPESNLYAPIPWGEGQTLLREALLAIDHNSYHIGQLIMVRKQLDAWEG
jgi:DinB superfamily